MLYWQVVHVYMRKAKRSMVERDYLWMNLAAGSGLWYNLRGTTLERDDFWGLNIGRATIINWLYEQKQLGRATVRFRRRVGDWTQLAYNQPYNQPYSPGIPECNVHAAHFPFYLHELVALRPMSCHNHIAINRTERAAPGAQNQSEAPRVEAETACPFGSTVGPGQAVPMCFLAPGSPSVHSHTVHLSLAQVRC